MNRHVHQIEFRGWVQWALRVLDNEELGARREAASAGTNDRLLDLRLSAARP